MDTGPRELDALLAQAGWAKALARSLVRDPDHADDLVQRAWLAALRHPPAESTPPRRWLATVLRNFARDDAREASSRRHRESAVARPDHAPGTDPIEDAASAQARLLAAVRELPEPSRSTVWARYYEGLAPREIAERDGVPVDTVKTRLARGLDALRKRFDREHGGDRRAWISALLPLAGAPNAAPNVLDPTAPAAPLVTTTLTTLAMDAKLKIAAVLAVAVCGAGLWVAARSDGVAPLESAFAAPLAQEIEDGRPRADPEAPLETIGETRVAIDAPNEEPAAPAPVALELRDGIVVDLEQRPTGGLEIVERSAQRPILVDDQAITSDALGRFQVPVERVGQLAARGMGWVTVFATLGDRDGELTIVVARAREIAGSVVDAQGTPVANALVGYHIDESSRRALGGSLRASIELAFEARTDEHGRFMLPFAPDGAGEVRARAENRRSGSTPVSPGHATDVVVVLPPPQEGSIFLRGRVVNAAGLGADRATVAIADVTAKSDAEGRFELPVSRAALESAQRTTRDGHPPVEPMPLVLRALKVGHLPATLVLPGLDQLERIADTEEFRLQLGGAPLSITGRVLDSEGQAIHGARVELLDEESFGVLPFEMAGMTVDMPVSIEQFLRGGFTYVSESTASDGSFTISGLQDRAYRIGVEVPSIPAALETEPIQAGRKDVEIRLDTSGARIDLAGRVVDGRGAELAGVVLRVHALANGANDYVGGAIQITDAAGRFTFSGVRGERFRLEAIGGDVQPAKIDVPEGTPLDDVLVSMTRLVYVQVDLGDRRELADTARFLDVRGQAVEFRIMRATESGDAETSIIWGSSTMHLSGGRSEVGSTAEGEYTCVLEKAGAEVARIPVRLGGSGVTIVRP